MSEWRHATSMNGEWVIFEWFKSLFKKKIKYELTTIDLSDKRSIDEAVAQWGSLKPEPKPYYDTSTASYPKPVVEKPRPPRRVYVREPESDFLTDIATGIATDMVIDSVCDSIFGDDD